MAIIPNFDSWMDRAHGQNTFHLTQRLTNYGSFAAYLNQIKKLNSDRCLECGLDRKDDADHVFGNCPNWKDWRIELKRQIGDDLTLPTIIDKMLENEANWKAVKDFANSVMLLKEEAGRAKEGIIMNPLGNINLIEEEEDPGD